MTKLQIVKTTIVKKWNTMTEKEMLNALGKHLFLKHVCIPNILMWGRGGGYEADMIYFNYDKRVITEIEVKVSIADFRADAKKRLYHSHHHIVYLYYAVPHSLWGKHKDEIENTYKGAGIIVVDDADCHVRYVKRAKKREKVVIPTESEILNYMRIGCMKWVKR